MRECLILLIGIIGGGIASALGGWDIYLRALVILMAVDFITGLVVAGVFGRSNKSNSGALSGQALFKGLLKKTTMLLIVLVAYQLDYVAGVDFVRYAAIIALISNESLSFIENAGLMGIPIPNVLKQAIEILKKKGDGNIRRDEI
jgi:toxin secretion/phage lysis holin